MPRRTTTRDDLLDAALQHGGEAGFHGTSVRAQRLLRRHGTSVRAQRLLRRHVPVFAARLSPVGPQPAQRSG
ncbi:MAG: hypothetical protein Q4G45_07085 [Actinomycetia bacterium]|nr:hypothetical protein [Actinomycetes bacterium]